MMKEVATEMASPKTPAGEKVRIEEDGEMPLSDSNDGDGDGDGNDRDVEKDRDSPPRDGCRDAVGRRGLRRLTTMVIFQAERQSRKPRGQGEGKGIYNTSNCTRAHCFVLLATIAPHIIFILKSRNILLL